MAEPMYPGFTTKVKAVVRSEYKADVAVVAPIARSGRLMLLVKDLTKSKLPFKVMEQDVDPGTELDLEEGGTDLPVRSRRLETI